MNRPASLQIGLGWAFLLGSMLIMPTLQGQEPPIVIAHRGASGYLPEHTLPGVTMAHAQGAEYIEQDVVLTRDDVPIVLHDIYLEAVTDVAQVFPGRARQDGRYHVLDFTLQEIQQLRVSERRDLKTGAAVFPDRFPMFRSTFRIPTLHEEIELIQGLNRSTGRPAGIYVEIKQPRVHRRAGKDISQIVLQQLHQAGYRDQHDLVFVQCFDALETRRMREELGTRLRLVQLMGDGEEDAEFRTAAGLRSIAEYANAIGPDLDCVLKRDEESGSGRPTALVTMAHAENLLVHPYTVRTDALPSGLASSLNELVQQLVDARVDGMFADFPDQTRQAIQQATR